MGHSEDHIEDHPFSGAGATQSSSDFEFSVTLSPSSNRSAAQLCPADELFYKGQLLPLHLSPRLSLVRALLLSSSSSDDTSTTASRVSDGSSSAAESSRPSSVAEEDCSGATKRRHFAARFSSFLLNRGNKKNPTFTANHNVSPSSDKPAARSSSAKDLIRKCVEKVRPLYEKLSSLHHKKTFSLRRTGGGTEIFSSSHSFAGNRRSAYRTKSAASCPSSMRSSPSHSGLLSSELLFVPASSSSSMEELQSAIQAAIAHCKSTMAKREKAMAPVGSFKDDLCVL